MTPHDIFEMLWHRHQGMQPSVLQPPALEGQFRNASRAYSFLSRPDQIFVVDYSSFVAVRYYVGGMWDSGGLLTGAEGEFSASSSFATRDTIASNREQFIGTSILGWDIPGLRWCVSACAPRSRTMVPFLGRTDQWLVCDDPIPHFMAERSTLALHWAAPGDLSQPRNRGDSPADWPSLDSMADAVRREQL